MTSSVGWWQVKTLPGVSLVYWLDIIPRCKSALFYPLPGPFDVRCGPQGLAISFTTPVYANIGEKWDNLNETLCFTFPLIQSIPKETHIWFRIYLWPPLGRGPKIHMVDYVNRTPIYIIHHVNFWPSSPRGPQQNSEVNVCFFSCFGIDCKKTADLLDMIVYTLFLSLLWLDHVFTW